MVKPVVNSVLDLPIELMELILSYVSYDEMARIRVVCRGFDACCQRLLNRGFTKVEKYHALCFKRVKSQLPRRESERRTHPLARHCDVLSAIETRLSLLGMTYMKYVDMSLCCFIPGKVIDEIYRVLRFIQNNPNPPRVHELLQELRDISSMAMEYFEEKIAPSLKTKLSSTSNVMAVVSTPSSVSSCRSLPLATRESAANYNARVAGSAAKDEQESKANITNLIKQIQQSQNHNKREFNDIKVKFKDFSLLKREITSMKNKQRDMEKNLLEKDQTIAEVKAELEDLKKRMCEYDEKSYKEVNNNSREVKRENKIEAKSRQTTNRNNRNNSIDSTDNTSIKKAGNNRNKAKSNSLAVNHTDGSVESLRERLRERPNTRSAQKRDSIEIIDTTADVKGKRKNATKPNSSNALSRKKRRTSN